MTDAFRKVRSGQPLVIPARAYNAFVDAAVAERRREQTRGGGPLADAMPRGLVLVRNDSDQTIEPYHVLAISGVLVEPGENDQERTFHSRSTPPATSHPTRPCSPARRWAACRSCGRRKASARNGR